jgi:hypothetical protein
VRSVVKQFHRRNMTVPRDVSIESGPYGINDIIKIAKENLRQPPISKQSRDTSVSVYHCLYVDCKKVYHADENAAKNIGRRFLEEYVVVEEG